MDFMIWLQALVLGVIEGLTEFLPISSTGHLIIASEWINFKGNLANSFNIFIQLGAIVAVYWEYRKKISNVVTTLSSSASSRQLVYNLILGCLPAVIIGSLFIKHIKFALFNPLTVAWALIIGGLVILLVEKKQPQPRIQAIDHIKPLDALTIGVAQCLALIPGVSRSGATIIGAMVFGVERKVATEFSFFLAIPIISAASFYDIYKHSALFVSDHILLFAVGFIGAFFSAFIAVKTLLRFIATHTFIGFAWYRIALGIIILLTIAR